MKKYDTPDQNVSESPLEDVAKTARIVSWVKSEYLKNKTARSKVELQWYFNLAFYFGKQWVQAAPARAVQGGSSLLFTPRAPYWRSRPVINRIRPIVQTYISMLTSNKPNVNVVAASAEDRDTYAAQAAEQIWQSLFVDKRMQSKIRKAVFWASITGTGYLKSWWNSDLGSVEPILGGDGAPTGEVRNTGDIDAMAETPFHIFVPDLREEDIEQQAYVMHAQLRSKDWVKLNFPETDLTQKSIKPSGGKENEIVDESFLNLMGTDSTDTDKGVLVLEIWVKPRQVSIFPDGALVTMINDQIVQLVERYPYKHGRYPFAKLDFIPTGKYYASSPVEDLIPLQKELNRTRGQIIEAKNKMGKPQLVAARGSVTASRITTEPGLVIEYAPGFDPPRPLELQGLPSYILQEIDRLLADMMDVSGIHEVSKGTIPPGVTAATAISYLQERDESRMSFFYDSLEEAIEKIAHVVLSYFRDYVDIPRLIRITGPDGSFDAMTFKGSDLSTNLDVRTEAGSALPVSKAARQALMLDLMNMGHIPAELGLEFMQMGGVNKISEMLRVDEKQAQRENLRMSKVTAEMIQQHVMQEQQVQMLEQQQLEAIDPQAAMSTKPAPPTLIVPVNTWDNHAVHIEIHNRFRKGQQFEALPAEVKDLFEQHVQSHLVAMGQELLTKNPALAAGVPVDLLPGAEGEGEEQPPGPEPIPQLASGMEG